MHENFVSQGIVLWLEKHTGPVAVEVTKPETVDEMKAKNDVVILACVEGEQQVAFAAVAEYYADDDMRFLMSNDAEVLKKNECKLGSVVMFKNFDEPKVEYSGEINKSVSALQNSYSLRKTSVVLLLRATKIWSLFVSLLLRNDILLYFGDVKCCLHTEIVGFLSCRI